MIFDDFAKVQPPEFADSKGDPRLKHLLSDDLSQANILISTYPDDEGVKNNGGRVGASKAPLSILKYLLKMTPPGFSNIEFSSLALAGKPKEELSHKDKLEAGRRACATGLRNGKFWIGLGGGHDYGYCEGAGFLDAFSGEGPRPLVVNFDAHLDVRPYDENFITSGTPFHRLLTEFDNFDFIEVGVRDFCNRKAHFQWVQEKNGKVLTLEQMRSFGSLDSFVHLAGETGRPCFVSVDIDAFASHLAMGCSQSWPSGMLMEEFLPIFDFLFSEFEVKTLGVYEVSPALDQDDRTSKLAAEIIYNTLVKIHG